MLSNYFFTKKTPLPTILFDGNSWIAGSGSTGGLTFPQQTINLLNATGKNASLVNYGIAGQTIDQMQSDAVSQIDSQKNNYNILVGLELVNQWGLNTSQSKETIYSKYKQYFLDRKSAGWKYIIAVTPTKQGYYGRANWATDGQWFVEQMLAEFPRLGINVCNTWFKSELSDFNDTTFFSSDKIHKTNAGQGIEASTLFEVIIRL